MSYWREFFEDIAPLNRVNGPDQIGRITVIVVGNGGQRKDESFASQLGAEAFIQGVLLFGEKLTITVREEVATTLTNDKYLPGES